MPQRKVPILEDFIKIDVHQTIMDDHWSQRVNGFKLALNPIRIGADYCIQLSVNDVPVDRVWKVYCRPLRGSLQRNGKIPPDKSEVFYIIGDNNKRYRYLYINPATNGIGTRADHCARFLYNCLSHPQREKYRKTPKGHLRTRIFR
jgi:hypothetical protein